MMISLSFWQHYKREKFGSQFCILYFDFWVPTKNRSFFSKLKDFWLWFTYKDLGCEGIHQNIMQTMCFGIGSILSSKKLIKARVWWMFLMSCLSTTLYSIFKLRICFMTTWHKTIQILMTSFQRWNLIYTTYIFPSCNSTTRF